MNHDAGQLEEKEFIVLKQKIDRSIYKVSKFVPYWQSQVSISEKLNANFLFSLLGEDVIDELLKNAESEYYFPDTKIIKENRKAENIYFISRGIGTDISLKPNSIYREKLKVGNIIGLIQLILPTSKYQTSWKLFSF